MDNYTKMLEILLKRAIREQETDRNCVSWTAYNSGIEYACKFAISALNDCNDTNPAMVQDSI